MSKILGKHIPSTPKNLLINGDMRIAQRGTSFAAIADNTYTLDRFLYRKTGAMVHTISQDTDVPSLAQAGYLFQNSIRLNLTTPDTSIAVGDYTAIHQKMEGYNFATIAQKPFTLSFWVKAPVSGIYCVAFTNSGNDRSYVAEYTVNGINTWEYKSVVVSASPSAGTWNYTNGEGLRIQWTIACGSTFQTTANAWQTGNFFATSNQVNGVNTGATDFRIVGAMLNEGALAFPFKLFGEDIAGEILACQRYYEKTWDLTTAPGTAILAGELEYIVVNVPASTAGVLTVPVKYTVHKRISVVPVIYSGTNGAANSITNGAGTARSGVSAINIQGSTSFGQIALNNSSAVATGTITRFHYTADAEI